MKKILSWILLSVLAFSLFGCGSRTPSDKNDASVSPKPAVTAAPSNLPSNGSPAPSDAMTEYRKTIESQKVYLLSYKEFPVDDIYVLGDETVKAKFDTASITVLMITPSEYDSQHSTYSCHINGGLEHTEYADPHGTYWADSYNHKNEYHSTDYCIIVLKAYGRIDMESFDFQLYDNMFARSIHDEYISIPIISDEKTLDDVGDLIVKIDGGHYLVKQDSGWEEGYSDDKYHIDRKYMFIPLDCSSYVDPQCFSTEMDPTNSCPRHIDISRIPDHMCLPEGSTGIMVTRYLDYEGDTESSEHDEQMTLFLSAVDKLVVTTDGEPLTLDLPHR